jgi:hypothetical protein
VLFVTLRHFLLTLMIFMTLSDLMAVWRFKQDVLSKTPILVVLSRCFIETPKLRTAKGALSRRFI